MSKKVFQTVRNRRLGVNSTAKALLLLMADFSDDKGGSIYPAKATLADILECTKRTVQTATAELIKAGFLLEAGKKRCDNGYTQIYQIDIQRVKACPTIDTTYSGRGEEFSPVKNSAGGEDISPLTPENGDQGVKNFHLTSEEFSPNPSLIRNSSSSSKRVRDEITDDDLLDAVWHAAGIKGPTIPPYWMPPAATIHVGKWRSDLGLTASQIIDTVKANRRNHSEPPHGPKALDRAMRILVQAKSAKYTPANQHASGPTQSTSVLARIRSEGTKS